MKLKVVFPAILWIFCTIPSLSQAQDRTFLLSRLSFGLDLFRNLSDTNSMVMSPLSVDLALSVLFFGSSQQTFLELMAGLHYPRNYSVNLIQTSFQLLCKNLKKVNGLEIATKVFITKQNFVSREFQDTIFRVLNAQIDPIDFLESGKAANTINNFAANATHNMIKEVVDAQSLNDDTRLILVNCVYFKGSWTTPFPKKRTFRGNFYLDELNTAKVDFMTVKSKFKIGYFEELGEVYGLSLPYMDSGMSMLLLLPDDKNGLSNLIANLPNIDFLAIDKAMELENVVVQIPKFNITFSANLNEVLGKMGINSIFDQQQAVLNRMLAFEETDINLHVGSIIHKAVINVDEEGAEAAAVTASLHKALPSSFVANSPFLFMLRSGANIVFMGQFLGTSAEPLRNVAGWRNDKDPKI